jgi:Nuclease-related domain
MARMYPEVFPGLADPAIPEFQVYQTLKCLSDHYHVYYSKRFTGGLFGKPECEIDFIVFNGRDVLTCIEVKGGLMSYDGVERRWLQNGRPCKDILKQAADASHTLSRALTHELTNACVDWALCFPDCCLSSHAGAFEVHPKQIIDESAMQDISLAMSRLESSHSH